MTMEQVIKKAIEGGYKYRWYLDNEGVQRLKKFIREVAENLYEKGKEEGSKGDYGRKLFQQGHDEGCGGVGGGTQDIVNHVDEETRIRLLKYRFIINHL